MDIGYTIEEFHNMTFNEFVQRCEIYDRKYYDKWRHTRELIAIHTKKTGRQIMPLPGDNYMAKDIKPLRPDQLKAIQEMFKNGRSK